MLCSEKKKNEEKVYCEPCVILERRTDATKFCKTCEDQETFCDNCAQHHICHKATRNHEICDDLGQLSKSHSASDYR